MNWVLKSCVIWPLPISPSSLLLTLFSHTDFVLFPCTHQALFQPGGLSHEYAPCSYLPGITPLLSTFLYGWLTCFGSQFITGVTVTQYKVSFPYPSCYCSDLFYFHYCTCCCFLVVQLCPTRCNHIDCSPPGSPVHGDSPSKSTGVGFHALLQGIFPNQGTNLCLRYCKQILYWLSHQESFLNSLNSHSLWSSNLMRALLWNNYKAHLTFSFLFLQDHFHLCANL